MVAPLVTMVVLAAAAGSVFAQGAPTTAEPANEPPVMQPPAAIPLHDRDIPRVELAATGQIYASFPGSMTDEGFALTVAPTLWLSKRWRFFQWVADGFVQAGFGMRSAHVHTVFGARFGGNLFLGPVFGLELRVGAAGVAQLGKHTVGGAAMAGSGAYVFRFWDDDRRRIKLTMLFHAGGFFADDPGNDLGSNAIGMGLGLAYEMPL